MNYHQDNKLSMYLAVQKNCQANATQWNTNAIAAQAFADFEQCILTIQQNLRQQERDLTGVSLDKADTRKVMIDKAYVIAQALVTYGHSIHNQELVHLVGHSRSAWEKYRSNLAKEMVEQVVQAAQLLMPALDNYGIKSEQVVELEALLQAYSQKITAPRVAILDRREATQVLEECFQKSDFLLQQLDNMLLQFQDKPFYQTYKNARKIVKRRPRGEKEVAAVVPVVPN